MPGATGIFTLIALILMGAWCETDKRYATIKKEKTGAEA